MVVLVPHMLHWLLPRFLDLEMDWFGILYHVFLHSKSKHHFYCGLSSFTESSVGVFLDPSTLTPEVPPLVFTAMGLVEWVELATTLYGATGFGFF